MIERLEDRNLMSATVADGVLTVTGNGDDNTIHVRVEGKSLIVFEDGDETRFRFGSIKKIVVNGRGGDDFVANGTSVPSKLVGGDGADLLSGGRNGDTLVGGGGSDDLRGHMGNDLLEGGAGNDKIAGGDGEDTVTYYNRKAGVTVNLATGKGGGPKETDSLSEIENVRGGHGDDKLYGDSDDNELWGGEGDDTIEGRGGDDSIFGEGLASNPLKARRR